MKLSGEIQEATVTQRQLARALKLGTTRINQLIDEGVVIRDEFATNGQVMLFESLQNYFLSKRTTGEGVNFWQERGLHERAKRELAQLKLSVQRGELYEAQIVEAVLSELLTNFRNKLTGLPSKLSAQLEGRSRADIYEVLTAAIEEELEGLSARLKQVSYEGEAGIEGRVVGSDTPGDKNER